MRENEREQTHRKEEEGINSIFGSLGNGVGGHRADSVRVEAEPIESLTDWRQLHGFGRRIILSSLPILSPLLEYRWFTVSVV